MLGIMTGGASMSPTKPVKGRFTVKSAIRLSFHRPQSCYVATLMCVSIWFGSGFYCCAHGRDSVEPGSHIFTSKRGGASGWGCHQMRCIIMICKLEYPFYYHGKQNCLWCESHQRWWQQTAQWSRLCWRLNETQMLLVLCVRAAEVWGLRVSLHVHVWRLTVLQTHVWLSGLHTVSSKASVTYRTLITAQCFAVSRCQRSWKNGKFNYFSQMRHNKFQHSLKRHGL